MIINNVELPDIDTADADILEHYENTLNKYKDDLLKIDTANQSGSQIIRQECRLIFGVFNELFGAGTDKKIFGDKTNVIICAEAFDQLTKAVKRTDKSNSEKIKALLPAKNQNKKSKHNKNYNYYKPKLAVKTKK